MITIPWLDWILDLGSLAHFIFGLIAGFLGGIPMILFTEIFLFEQYRDWKNGEDPSETERDVAEYVIGLIIALIIVAAL